MSKVFLRLRSRGQLRAFRVTLKIHHLDSIPVTPTPVFVGWKVDDQAGGRNEARTNVKLIEKGNVVRWDETFEFVIHIPSDPKNTVLLQPCIINFSVRRIIGKRKNHEKIGVVALDLSEIAGVGKVEKNCLLQHSKLNATLKLTLRLKQEKGDEIFQRPIRRRSMSVGGSGLGMSSLALGIGTGGAGNGTDGSLSDRKSDLPLKKAMKHCRTGSFRKRRATSLNHASHSSPELNLKAALNLRSVDDIGIRSPTDDGKAVGGFAELVPEELQRGQFEKLFDARLRDKYPDYVKESRVNAVEALESLFASDELSELPQYATTKSSNSEASDRPNELNLESLLESRWTYVTMAGEEGHPM